MRTRDVKVSSVAEAVGDEALVTFVVGPMHRSETDRRCLCQRCGGENWLSTHGQQVLDGRTARGLPTELICAHCAPLFDPEVEVRVTRESLGDLAAARTSKKH